MEGVGSLLALPPQTKGTPVCQGFPSLVSSAGELCFFQDPWDPPPHLSLLSNGTAGRLAPLCPAPCYFMKSGQISQVSLSAVISPLGLLCRMQPRAHLPCTTDIFLRRLGPNTVPYPDVRPSWAPVSPSLLQQSLGATLSQLSLVCLLHLHYPHEMPWVGTLLPPSVGVLPLIFWPL